MKITRHSSVSTPQTAEKNRLTLGLLTVNIIEPWEQLVWHGCLDAARDHDANLICFSGRRLYSAYGFDAQANVVYDLAACTHRLDGVIVWFGEDKEQVYSQRFSQIPIVAIDDSVGSDAPCILMDNYQSMRHALIHLIQEHEYRKIAFIRGPEFHYGIQERYRAYQETLAEFGLPVDPQFTYIGLRETLQEEELTNWLLKTLSGDIDAVVGHNDHVALLAQQALQHQGIRVPEDVAVVGFDDIAEAQVVSPALTTVHPPFYNMGRTAVETLLQSISGGDEAQQILLHGTVIKRESCGCISPVVARAASQPLAFQPSHESIREALLAQHFKIVDKIIDLLGETPQIRSQIVQVFDAAIEAVETMASTKFLGELRDILRQATTARQDLVKWHDVISVLRQHVWAYCNTSDTLLFAENLWQQSRVIIGEMSRRIELSRSLQAERQNNLLRQLGARLITTFDIGQLMTVLEDSLFSLGFPSVYLALYEQDPDDQQSLSVPEWSQLMLAYTHAEHVMPYESPLRFSSFQLIPDAFFPTEQRYAMVIEPLYFQDQQIGFVLFEIGPLEGKIYEALREQLSSALQGALLVEREQKHAAEVARQQYILDTFMETVPDSIYFKDLDSRIIRANTAHAQHLGFRVPEEELGTTDFDLFPEEQAQIRYEQEQAIIQSGEPIINLEESLSLPDSRVQWALTTKMPLRDEHGAIIGTFGISRDITQLKQAEQELRQYREHLQDLVVQRTAELTRINTLLNEEIVERRRAEQALRLSERQYRMLAENVMEGVVIVQDSKLTVVNAAFAAMLGYSVDDLAQRAVLPLFPEHEQAHVQTYLMRGEQESTVPPWQAEILIREGALLWIAVSQARIVWENRPALVLTVRNIHASKLREQQLEQERQRLQQENLTFKSTLSERYKFGEIIGKSPVIQRIYELIVNAAVSEVNVLVVGESGTGKELIARTIHQVSARKQKNFVAVNCASIPETLFEREFFGHRKGAFTGADRDRAGLFDRAHQGTLFLDEVTELSPAMQAKLLRVLQDGEYFPVGSTIQKQADVVIIAATNKDWKTLIQRGLLREDFFYRICVVEIQVPALRDRKEDIPFLVEYILEQYRQKQEQRQGRRLDDVPRDQSALPGEFVQALYAHHWPGNIRELQNVLQRYLVTNELAPALKLLGTSLDRRSALASAQSPLPEGLTLSEAVKAFEKQMIAHLLAQYNNHTGKVAEMLGITRRALQYKIKAYELRKSS